MAEADVMQGTRFEDHGTRSEIEDIAAVGDVSLQAGGPPSAVNPQALVQPGGAQALQVPSPVERLGGMQSSGDPMTAGLSVGPGVSPPSPATAGQALKLSRIEKLVALSTMARSPHIRAQAQAALRMMAANSRNIDQQEVG